MPEKPAKKENEKKLEAPRTERPEALKVLLEWTAPIRPFKRRDRKYFTTVISLVVVLALILIFILLQHFSPL